MKVKALQMFSTPGSPEFYVGETYTLDETTAAMFIERGLVEAVTGETKKTTAKPKAAND